MRNYNYLFLLIFLVSEPVYAHKVKLFATVAGEVVSGYVYFPGGERAKSIPVKIFLADNQLQETVFTDAQGEFQFHAKVHATHHLIANLGEGHLAEYTIDASEFEDNLSVSPAESSINNSTEIIENCNISDQLPEILAKAVNQQIRPLREQLEAYQEKIWLHDILGGIGYIFGTLGILAYFAKLKN